MPYEQLCSNRKLVDSITYVSHRPLSNYNRNTLKQNCQYLDQILKDGFRGGRWWSSCLRYRHHGYLGWDELDRQHLQINFPKRNAQCCIQISMLTFLMGPIKNKLSLDQVTRWRRTTSHCLWINGEPHLATQFVDAQMWFTRSQRFKQYVAIRPTYPPLMKLTLLKLDHGITTHHYGDVIMDAIASQITSLTIVYSIVYSDADQRKHQSSASLAFVRRIHRGPVNSPHKWPVTRKMFPFDDVIMILWTGLTEALLNYTYMWFDYVFSCDVAIPNLIKRVSPMGFIQFNTLRLRQNGRHFADDTLKRIFLNENVCISIKISLTFVLKGPINNIPALGQIMAWRRPGDKPLSEPIVVSLPTHICVTRSQ